MHHSYCFLRGKNLAAAFGRLFFSMCKTETSGTTNAFHSSNQALMDHCSGFEWCVPWGEKNPENYSLYVGSNNSSIRFVLACHKLQWKRIRYCTNQLSINVSVFPYMSLYLL